MIFDYFCGFFDFLVELHKKFHYYGNISLTLKIKNIQNWNITYDPYRAQQNILTPIRKSFSIDQLKNDKIEVLKQLIGPVLNAYGRTNEDTEVIYEMIKSSLL